MRLVMWRSVSVSPCQKRRLGALAQAYHVAVAQYAPITVLLRAGSVVADKVTVYAGAIERALVCDVPFACGAGLVLTAPRVVVRRRRPPLHRSVDRRYLLVVAAKVNKWKQNLQAVASYSKRRNQAYSTRVSMGGQPASGAQRTPQLPVLGREWLPRRDPSVNCIWMVNLHRPTWSLMTISFAGERPTVSCSVPGGADAAAQGLTLVHFSAQPEPFLPLKPCNHPTYPTKCAHVKPKKWTSVSPWRTDASRVRAQTGQLLGTT